MRRPNVQIQSKRIETITQDVRDLFCMNKDNQETLSLYHDGIHRLPSMDDM